MDDSQKVDNRLSTGWAVGLLVNALIWLFIGLRSGNATHLIMGTALLLGAFAAFKIKVLPATPATHFLFYSGSALMLISAVVALRQ